VRKIEVPESVSPDMRPLDPTLLPAWHRNIAARRRQHQLGSSRAERRAERRFPIANTEVHSHTVVGRVIDLNGGGMSIESHAALKPGGRYSLTLSIGDHAETLEARVLWCRLLATRRSPNGDVVPVYRAGIERVRPPKPESQTPEEATSD
jgi:hypothetical protein